MVSLGAIEEMAARQFALAAGELSPQFHDQKAASEAGYAGIAVMPLFLTSRRVWGPGLPEAGLLLDGTVSDDVGLAPGMRVLGGGQSLTILDDVIVGDELEMTSWVVSADLKESRNGALIVVTIRRQFSKNGRNLVICDETRVLR
jgi:acyl dehydratase